MARKMESLDNRIRCVGYAAKEPTGKLGTFKFDRRALGDHDVLIDVLYCGICHSDVHKVRSEWGRSHYPIVPGHEIVGKVADAGKGARGFRKGDIVGVGCMVDSCARCEACRANAEYDCHNGTVWTYDSVEPSGGITYGGYSDRIVVKDSFTLKISKKADLAATAPLLCAGTTTYTPLRYWKIGPGQKVGIIGLGGLGHIAVKLANSLGADVTVLTTSPGKVDDAVRLGAKGAIVISDANEMKKNHGSFDFILDTASSKHDLNAFMALLKRNGKLVIVGIPKEQLEIHPFSLVDGHRVLAGSGLGGIKETQEMLDYCASKGIGADVEAIPIQKVNEAYDRIVRGDVRYRFVIDMSSLNR